MKLAKLFTFILITGLLAACGGKQKTENEKITKEALIGKWQPVTLEFKNIPALLKNQISKENLEKELLSDSQKKGYLELKKDGTIILKDTPSADEIKGTWNFDGDKKIEIEIEDLKIASGNKNLKIGFHIESVSKEKLEIDYASIYKVMAGVDKIPFFDVKMIMSYKRAE
jgi:hypothetical protein